MEHEQSTGQDIPLRGETSSAVQAGAHLPVDDDEPKANRVVAMQQEVQSRWLRDVMTALGGR